MGRGFEEPRQRVQNSLGSGVILSDDGYVVSNYHVVGSATEIRVVTTDRREFSAEVVLGHEESDIAILRLEGAEDLPYLTFRDSDQVEVGELALAIGNPFGGGGRRCRPASSRGWRARARQPGIAAGISFRQMQQSTRVTPVGR